MWMLYRTSDTAIGVYKSTNKGTSWSNMGSWPRSDLQDIVTMRIDANGESLHAITFISTDVDRMYYRRIPITGGTPNLTTGEVLWTNGGGNSTPQSFLISADMVPITHPDGSLTIVSCRTAHGSTSGNTLYATTVLNNAARSTYANNGLFSTVRMYHVSGDDTALTPSIDFEHNGDGITSASPSVWSCWQAFDKIYCVRAAFQGYKTGWRTPSTAYIVATGRGTIRDVVGRWDGQRFLIVSRRPSDTSKLDVFERPATNSGNSILRTSPSHPVGNISTLSVATNHVTRDFRLFGSSGTGTIYYVDYIRATNTWGAWTQVSSTAPVVDEWGVRKTTGKSYQYDVFMQSGASSPWTVSNVALPVVYNPTAPTWTTGTAGTVSTNGAAYDVVANLTLDWNFNDPNPAEAQSAYALQRQIGGAAAQWWRTSDSTWQAVETWNSTSTTSVTLTPTQWVGGGGAADATHVYRVATKDNGFGTLTSPYSAGLSIVPSARIDPTVTAPTVNQILNSGTVGVTWTVTEQSQWRVQLRPTIAYDPFTRSVSNGWGTADYGGAWTSTGGAASDFSVASNVGRHSHAANDVLHTSTLAGVYATDLNIYVAAVTVGATPLTQPIEWGVRARYLDVQNYVDARIYFATTGPQIVVRSLYQNVEVFSSFVTPAGIGLAGPVSLRFVVDGDTLYGRIWNPSSAEPTEWQVTCPATMLDAGSVMVQTRTYVGNTNTKPFVVTTDGLLAQHASLVNHDTGFRTDALPLTPSTLEYTPPVVLEDKYAGVVSLTTKNAEGLSSITQAVPFTVDYVEPVAPVVTVLAAAPGSGGINVAVSAGPPTGAQPATSRLDIWRRVSAGGAVLTANPWFETNHTDWQANPGLGVGRSTLWAHTGVGSLLLTPNGVATEARAETVAYTTISPDVSYQFTAWVRPNTANKTIRIALHWYDNSNVLVSSTVEDATPVAGVWIFASVAASAPPNATKVRPAVGLIGTPAGTDTMWIDEAELRVENQDPGFRIETEAVSGQTYLDWRAVTGVDYEYRGYAEAGNGTSVWGPWEG
jgi:hypothetical protein